MRNFFIFSVLVLLFSSCVRDDTCCSEDDSSRTLLVYIGRDNNLHTADEDKREAIIEGWDGKGGHLMIYQDLPEGSRLEKITKKQGVATSWLITESTDENSADPETFRRVIQTMLRECPADSYGLVLFSHASGWLPDATLTNPQPGLKSLVVDQGRWMNLSDFASAIPPGLFHFILFEACYMGGIEVAYELKEQTNFLLTSPAELLSPGFREVYRTSINRLYMPEPDLLSFAKEAERVLGEDSHYQSLTLSLIRTSSLEALARMIRSYPIETDFPPIEGIQTFDRLGYHLFFDFEQHYSRYMDDTEKKQLARLLKECVIYAYHTPSFLVNYNGFMIEHYSGLTTYIPQSRFSFLNEAYRQLQWTQAIQN